MVHLKDRKPLNYLPVIEVSVAKYEVGVTDVPPTE